jgi:hypothetical protein
MNLQRPEGMKLSTDELPINGVCRQFFNECVPTQIAPEWNFMGQEDGTYIGTGYPYYNGAPKVSFGKKKRPYRKSSKNACSNLNRKSCKSSPMCKYVTGRGCARKHVKKTDSGYHLSGDDDIGSYNEEAGIDFGFGKRLIGRKRYNVMGSGCNHLSKRVCASSPNCSYTKRGCRRRAGTKSKGLIYEGPSLAQFGKKLRNMVMYY